MLYKASLASSGCARLPCRVLTVARPGASDAKQLCIRRPKGTQGCSQPRIIMLSKQIVTANFFEREIVFASVPKIEPGNDEAGLGWGRIQWVNTVTVTGASSTTLKINVSTQVYPQRVGGG